MLKKIPYLAKGFTLLEVLVVIIIIGIVAALGLPNFLKTKESTLEREVKANLMLIRAAEKSYNMDNNSYFISAVLAAINSNLKLSLPAQNWNYKVDAGTGFTAKAQRVNDSANVRCIDQSTEDPYQSGCSW